MDGQRPYSIRTRIKTHRQIRQTIRRHLVRDHIPLEQGLRQLNLRLVGPRRDVRDHIPLEQGLRPAAAASGDCVSAASETIFH